MTELIVIVVCLSLNAIFAAYEMAFVSFTKPELRRLSKPGARDAQILLIRRENPERTLSVIQIGITLVGVIAAAVGGAGATESIEPYLRQQWELTEFWAEILSIILVVVPLTYFSVVLGELVPKTLALRHPGKIALAGAKMLFVADRILAPIVSVLEWSTKILIRLFFKSKKPIQAPEITVELETLPPFHQQYILNLARIESKRIGEMMVKWEDVDHINKSDSMAQVADVIFHSGHTRLPVVDLKGQVVGILHTKEFLAFRDSGQNDWTSLIREALRVRTQDSVLGALRMMQHNRSHMAIVSSNGERLGILTLEDIIEEIVGDISDEDDDGRVKKIIASRPRWVHR